MIKITIPERNELKIENAVFDFNGTLAVNGRLHQKVREMVMKIKGSLNIYIFYHPIHLEVYLRNAVPLMFI